MSHSTIPILRDTNLTHKSSLRSDDPFSLVRVLSPAAPVVRTTLNPPTLARVRPPVPPMSDCPAARVRSSPRPPALPSSASSPHAELYVISSIVRSNAGAGADVAVSPTRATTPPRCQVEGSNVDLSSPPPPNSPSAVEGRGGRWVLVSLLEIDVF
jgi:hypothetical protein